MAFELWRGGVGGFRVDADQTARDDRGVPALRIDELAHLIVGPSDQIGDGRIGTPHDAIGRFEGGYEIRRDDAHNG